ncbi:MAG TPA: Spy/CpxP family protein refolding chaperone [Armatimonadota bacterium]|nr:Spy/CpxP family protein refolding chaperone [Armatimonadota bacterium]
MQKKAIFIGIAVVLVLLMALSLAFAATRAAGAYAKERGEHHGMMGRWATQLNLTDDQKAQMKAIWEKYRTDTQPIRDEMKAKHEELVTVLKSDTPDRAKAHQLTDEISALRGQMASAGIDKLLDAREVLTPAQRATIAQKMEHHKGGFGMMGHCPIGR